MKLDLDKTIEDHKGATVKRENGKPFTIRDACQEALLSTFPDEQNLSGAEKNNRFKLCMRLANGADDLQVEDLAKIKEVIAKAFSPLVVGRVYEAIESSQ